ncbi:MAG TPA: glycosyltransferase family A protein [Vicinamibacterales bacterium]|jgi:glycosyltransferase involved in cell wall biosynthesis|nr:glycosyltransferase family A protein [Vicinamibacterales bacterium]
MNEFPVNTTQSQHPAAANVSRRCPTFDVAVIVPTFNRAPSLAGLLDSLCQQQRLDELRYEVVVVDNGSTDRTQEVAADYSRRFPFVRCVRELRPGASNARNRGILSADARILAFIDDDIRASSNWIAAIVRTFEQHPEIDCLGGRVEPLWPRTPPSWLTPSHWGPLALQMGRGTSQYIDAEHASACLVTANFACRAEVLREVGLFSPDFVRDEDRELNMRLWAAGKRGKYEHGVVAFAKVQPERLGKAYHRRWHEVTGESHARLRYREAIDRDGHLRVPADIPGRSFLGSPAFLYRELLGHGRQWISKVLQARWDDAFIHECRIRYLVSYVVTRWRTDRAARADARQAAGGRGNLSRSAR